MIKKNINTELQKVDTYELFAQLTGHAVFNHQRINSCLKRLNVILREGLEDWKTGVPRRRALIPPSSVDLQEWIDPYRKLQNTFSDADVIGIFDATFESWHDIQKRFTTSSGSWPDVHKKLAKCISDENTLRNHLVHSEFVYDAYLEPLDQIRNARAQTGSGPKKGKVAIRVMERQAMQEFVGFQFQLIEVLEDFFYGWKIHCTFYFDQNYILSHPEKFDHAIIDFVKNAQITSGVLASHFEDPKNDEISAYLNEWGERITKLDETRKSLKIKSANFDYDWEGPTEHIIWDLD